MPLQSAPVFRDQADTTVHDMQGSIEIPSSSTQHNLIPPLLPLASRGLTRMAQISRFSKIYRLPTLMIYTPNRPDPVASRPYCEELIAKYFPE